MMVAAVSLILFLAGIYCVAVKKNLFKLLIGFFIMEYGVILFLHSLALRGAEEMTLIIGLAGLAAAIILSAIIYRINKLFGTLDISQIRKLKG